MLNNIKTKIIFGDQLLKVDFKFFLEVFLVIPLHPSLAF